jgi:alkylated DNA nucleotide flippase Atl1
VTARPRRPADPTHPAGPAHPADPTHPDPAHPGEPTHLTEPLSMVDYPHGSPPLDDFASRVLDVVDSIPAGCVMSYGDIAEHLGAGMGPRQVGRVMSVYGGAVAWWRVIHSDGTPAPGHDSKALQHYLAEGTPLRSARPPVRVDMRRARWPGR